MQRKELDKREIIEYENQLKALEGVLKIMRQTSLYDINKVLSQIIRTLHLPFSK